MNLSIELLLVPIGIATISSIKAFANQKNDSFIIPTIMKKEDLLQKSIEQYGCKVTKLTEQNYQTTIEDLQIYFQLTEQGYFEAIFNNSVDTQAAMEFIENLQTEYKYLIQQETYQHLLKQAAEHGLHLESEIMQEDRTIVLTFNVNNISK